MSDEKREGYYSNEGPEEGETEHEWLQRTSSPELQWRYLLGKLVARVEINENRVEEYAEESRRRDERIESRIEFILGQQAQFTADMQQLRDAQAHSERRWERAERLWARTEESVRALLTLAESHEGDINALQDAQARLTESQARTDRQMAETDERINALVGAVEALISERRDGGSEAREG